METHIRYPDRTAHVCIGILIAESNTLTARGGTTNAPRQQRWGCQKNPSEIYRHSDLGPFGPSRSV